MKPLKSIEQLTNSFSLLPGVGHKSAEKMAYSVLTMSEEQANEFSQAILRVKREIKQCKKCGNYCRKCVYREPIVFVIQLNYV